MLKFYYAIVALGMWIGAGIDRAIETYMRALGAMPGFGSIMQKMPHGRVNVGNANGGYAIANGQIKIELNKDFFVPDHRVTVAVSQVFATTAPNASDVRRFFSQIQLNSNEGVIFTAPFDMFYDMMRYLENASAPAIYFGVAAGAPATALFSFNMHHANFRAALDLLTGLQTANFSTLNLTLSVNPDNANGFLGGVGPAAATYQVAVDAVQIADPAFSGTDANSRKAIVYGKARHHYKAMAQKVNVAGGVSPQELLLDTGGKTRFITFHSYTAAGVLANGIIDTINLSAGGVDYMNNVSFAALQQENIAERGFNQVGFACFDLGDDSKAWIPMKDLNSCKLKYSTLAGAPAGCIINVGQDYSIGLEALNA